MKAQRFLRAPLTPQGEANIREDERRRLARELHDGPAQALAAAVFAVDLAVNALDRAPSVARDELLSARALVRDARDDVRALMAGLRPRLLEEQGLVAALRSLAAMPPLWGTEVSVATRGIAEGARLPPEIELALFRIAQEAVSNARRHGAASHVRVELDADATVIALRIADDGRGMPGGTVQTAFGLGEGLPGMRERAQLLGGDVTIDSTPGTGTRVSVSLPLPLAGGGAELGERTA
jgi:two-component system sensor histidine kinase DegS